MKHDLRIIAILVLLFLAAQFIGLTIVQRLTEKELAFGIQRPKLDQERSVIFVFLIIIFVTVIALIIARFNAIRIFKVWFFISLALVLTIAISAFTHQYIALFLALLVTYF